jgi:hypothetical protein
MYNALKTTLLIFKKTLDPVPAPGLKGTIGGALKIIMGDIRCVHMLQRMASI